MRNLSKMIAVTVLMLGTVIAVAQNTGGYKILNGNVYYNNVILHEADPNTIQDLGYGYAKDNENVWLEGKLLPLVDARSFRLKNDPTPPPPPHSAAVVPSQSAGAGIGNVISSILGVAVGRNPVNGPAHGPVHGPAHGPAHGPGHNHVPAPGHDHIQQEIGYEVIGTKVYYNGTVVSNASAHSFKDLGCGYAKDSYRVYYCGKTLTDNPSRFTALTDGYAKDSFNVYYFGKKIGASTSGFKVLSDGYAKDAFDAYYCGKEVVGSSASTFKVTGNGYAKDSWETYYLGKKVR